MKPKRVLILSGLLMELLYILYRVIPSNPAQAIIKYIIVYSGGFILLAFTSWLVKHQEFSRFFFFSVLLFSFLFGITLLSAPPDQSDDIYRYLWDGKLQYSGISPYKYAPDDPALMQYNSEQLPKLVNFPHIKTIYPPAAQLFFLVSHSLFGESVIGMKFLFLLTLLGSTCFFYWILKEKKAKAHWLLFFAWNPLVIMETAVNGHLDILMVFFLLISLWCFYKKKLIFSGICLACAILSKLIPVILLPIFFIFLLKPSSSPTSDTHPTQLSNKIKQMLLLFIPCFFTISVFYYLYFESAQNMFLTAINYSTRWYFNNPLFLAILSIFKNNTTAHMISFSFFIVLYILILIVPFESDKKIFFALGAFVLCNPTIHPWYLIILLAMLCIRRSKIVVLWSGLVIISYFVVYRFKLTGTWQDSWLLMGIEYVPLVIFLIYQWYRKRNITAVSTPSPVEH